MISVSRNTLAAGVLVVCCLLTAGGIAFYLAQNSAPHLGGPVAPQKLIWLGYALLLWVVIPVAIALDGRAAPRLRMAFAVLFGSMLARGAIELWMLYVSLNWSPWYGIAHDLACIAVLALFGAIAWREYGGWRLPNGLLFLHLHVTALMFIPEIYFAHYMTKHFDTTGEGAIYFVPGEARHHDVLRVTAAVVTAMSVYLPLFIWGWLVGTPRSKHTRAL